MQLSPVRFHIDENVAIAVAIGLRQRGVDVTIPRDVQLTGASDLAHLDFALGDGRVVGKHDRHFIAHYSAGVPHAGIAYCCQGKYSAGELIQILGLMHFCMTADEMRNHLEYL